MTAAHKSNRHCLDGQMFLCTTDEIYSALMQERPTTDQLIDLGLEELQGHDRAAVYRILELHKPQDAA